MTNKKLICFQLFFLLQITFYIITYAFSDSNETSQLQIIFVFYIVYPVVSLFIIKTFLRHKSKNNIIILFLIAIITQAILSIFITFSAEFRSLSLSMLNVDMDRLDQSANVRFIGFGIAYFNLGTVMILGALLSIYLLKNKDNGIFFTSFLIFSLLLFIILGTFSARVSILGIIVVMLTHIYTKKNFKINKNLFSHSFLVLFFFPIIFSILYILLPSSVLDNADQFFDKSLPWAFEAFNNFLNGSGLQSSSTDELAKMFFLPKNLFTMLFGDARMYDGDLYYMHTDVGYIRQIFSYGILGLITSIIAYAYICNIIRKRFNSFLGITLFLLVLTFNIKGIFIYYSNFDFFIIFIFIYTLINEKTEQNIIERINEKTFKKKSINYQ
ncbi:MULTISPECIES: hypothetical protein [unclassified Providencia]|uniref:hypothetical protein n=1 Tax=unclassified Providencia TaxID=2633465 RepID=UPI00298F65DA|nr:MULTISPECIES: hypothetical protein [unclassified Providencia]